MVANLKSIGASDARVCRPSPELGVALGMLLTLGACTEPVAIVDTGSIGDSPDMAETPGTPGSGDLCAGSETPVITLGQGVGGSFAAYHEGEDVTLTPAPQGGFGISSIMRTQGLATGSNLTSDIAFVDITLDIEIDGINEGTWLVEEVSLLCSDPTFGGLLTGVVAGFDQDKYQDNDDLLQLDGTVVDIIATAVDEGGREAIVRQPVTVRVGG